MSQYIWMDIEAVDDLKEAEKKRDPQCRPTGYMIIQLEDGTQVRGNFITQTPDPPKTEHTRNPVLTGATENCKILIHLNGKSAEGIDLRERRKIISSALSVEDAHRKAEADKGRLPTVGTYSHVRPPAPRHGEHSQVSKRRPAPPPAAKASKRPAPPPPRASSQRPATPQEDIETTTVKKPDLNAYILFFSATGRDARQATREDDRGYKIALVDGDLIRYTDQTPLMNPRPPEAVYTDTMIVGVSTGPVIDIIDERGHITSDRTALEQLTTAGLYTGIERETDLNQSALPTERAAKKAQKKLEIPTLQTYTRLANTRLEEAKNSLGARFRAGVVGAVKAIGLFPDRSRSKKKNGGPSNGGSKT